jgi:hypothetical protein
VCAALRRPCPRLHRERGARGDAHSAADSHGIGTHHAVGHRRAGHVHRADRPRDRPRGDRTGIEAVDSAIAEIEALDIEALAARLRFVDLKCVEGEEFEPSPACADGEPPGTIVAVFRHGLGCHGGFRRDATATAEELLANELALHSVVYVEPTQGAPHYELLFVDMRAFEAPGLLVLNFHLEGAEIVTVTDGCGLAPLDFRAHRYTATRAAEVILRGPVFPPDME